MPVYDRKVWEMFLEIKNQLPAEFTPKDVIDIIHKTRPQVKANTIRVHMLGCTPNHPSRRYYSLPHDIFYYLPNGKFRLVNQDDTEAQDETTEEIHRTEQAWELASAKGPENHLVADRDSKVNVTLTWKRFEKFMDARRNFAEIPCVYVQTDSQKRPIRVGKASKGLQRRYWGGTGYAMGAAMHDSGNFIFVASVAEPLCEAVEGELIWSERETLQFNNEGKTTPPRTRLHIHHEGDPPNWQAR